MRGPETRLQRKIRKRLEEEFPGSFWVKIHVSRFQNRGIPDLLGCVRGVFFAFEVKLPGKHETEIQRAVIDRIRGAYGVSTVVFSPDQAVQEVFKGLRKIYGQNRVRSNRSYQSLQQ